MNQQNSPNSNAILYQQPYKIYKYVALTLSFVTCTVGILLFILFSDEGSSYLAPSPMTVVFGAFLVLEILLSVFAGYFFKKSCRITCMSKAISLFRLLPAAAAIYCVAVELSSAPKSALSILLVLFAALTAAHCVTRALNLNSPLSLCLGFGQTLFAILVVAKIYLDLVVELNAPAKLLILFAALSIAFSTLADLNLSLGGNSSARFVLTTPLAICLPPVAVVAVFNLPTVANGNGKDYLAYGIFFFACSVFEIVRLPFTTLHVSEDAYESLDSEYELYVDEEHNKE